MNHSDVTAGVLQQNGVESLLNAMGNIHYSDCQKQASICLNLLIESSKDETLSEKVRSTVGSDFYKEFRRDPEYVYTKMTSIQAQLLRNVQITV